jgi:hypothetical protein
MPEKISSPIGRLARAETPKRYQLPIARGELLEYYYKLYCIIYQIELSQKPILLIRK